MLLTYIDYILKINFFLMNSSHSLNMADIYNVYILKKKNRFRMTANETIHWRPKIWMLATKVFF